jgi:hypothetical protein
MRILGRNKKGKKVWITIPDWDQPVGPGALAASVANTSPTTSDVNFSIVHGRVTTVTLVAEDIDGEDITYNITALPNNSGSIYDPGTGFLITLFPYTLVNNGNLLEYSSSISVSGSDAFSFRVYDTRNYSNISTVTATVTNIVPTTSNFDMGQLSQSVSSIFPLTGSDGDSDAITYIITSLPNNSGSLVDATNSASISSVPYTLTLNGFRVEYTSTGSYAGTETFTYKVNDGLIDSNTSSGSIVVIA